MTDIKPGLWLNDKREKDTHPHLKSGKPVMINGQEYWLSGWLNAPESAQDRANEFLKYLGQANGSRPIISLSLQPVKRRSESGGNQAPAPAASNDFDDDIPF